METKKLTAKDLMIGDLVCYCKENNYLTKVESIHNTGHASVSDEYCIKCFRDRKDPLYDKNPIDFFNVEILHPIPLTAEILEKNGIRNYSELPEYKVRTNEYEIWVIFDEPQNCVHVEKFDKGIPTIYHSKILFVHELQHALRLCGINDKEIVL